MQRHDAAKRRLVTAALALAALPARAQVGDWPSRPIRLVVASGAGGSTDTFARLFAERLGRVLRQSFVVDNKPGANGIIANDTVAKAAPDGYTLLFSYAAAVAVNHALVPKLPYDALKDLQPIAQIGSGGNLLVVAADFAPKTLREFVDLMKAQPDRHDYASWGVGSGGHLAMEALRQRAGIALRHVPYKTVPQIYPDLISGVVKIAFVDATSSLPHIRAGRIRPLVTSGTRRLVALPEVPTMTESGYRFDVDAWYGLFAPAGTPMAVVRRLNEEVNRILGQEEMRTRFAALNMADAPIKTVEQFAGTLRDDIEAWGAVIRAANVKPVE